MSYKKTKIPKDPTLGKRCTRCRRPIWFRDALVCERCKSKGVQGGQRRPR